MYVAILYRFVYVTRDNHWGDSEEPKLSEEEGAEVYGPFTTLEEAKKAIKDRFHLLGSDDSMSMRCQYFDGKEWQTHEGEEGGIKVAYLPLFPELTSQDSRRWRFSGWLSPSPAK